MAPKHLTGLFGSCHQLLLCFAIVISALIGLGLPDISTLSTADVRKSASWRFGYGGCFAFSIVQCVLLVLVYNYETPSFYVNNGDDNMVFPFLTYRLRKH